MPGLTECLDDNAVVELVEGRASAARRAAADAHVDTCRRCRRLVAEVARDGAEAGPPDDLAPLARGAILGRYVLLEPIGAGGMGVVHAAYDPVLDRKVAIKMLHRKLPASSARDRILREAQAMARLSHANVVAVHDVGSLGERVFIAMDFVEGQTLRAWLAAQPRGWRTIVRVFLDAARGLAAAHAAGIVHRDFKPDNVLVGTDGSVRVGDFGVARSAAGLASDAAGSLVGTPAYMSPEHQEGGPGDARSDIFSFCVALYEALYGERPFAGTTMDQVRLAIVAGAVRPPPPQSEVPAWVGRAVAKGLAQRPEDRYPSMEEVIAALTADPRLRTRRRLLALGGTLAIAGLAALVGLAIHRELTVCGGAKLKLAGVWDAQRREAIGARFKASDAPYATAAWSSVASALDAYSQAWAEMHAEACTATRVRREQSEELLDRRIECLSRRREGLRALTDLLAAKDPPIDKAVQAAASLEPLAACADARALLAKVPLPRDEETRRRVADAEAQVASARALERAGRYAPGLEVAHAAVAAARKIDYPPALARALLQEGVLQAAAGDAKSAIAPLREAVLEAEAGGDDASAARASATLVQYVGVDVPRRAPSEEWAQHARAALRRIGGDDVIEADLLLSEGRVKGIIGEYTEAVEKDRRAVSLREKALGPESLPTAEAVLDLGLALSRLDRYEEAIHTMERAQAIMVRALGPDHPDIAEVANKLGSAYYHDWKGEQALREYKRALAIVERALPPTHPRVGAAYNNMGIAYHELDRAEDARVNFEKSRAIYLAAQGRESRMFAMATGNLGRALIIGHRFREAEASLRESLAINEKVLGKEHPELVTGRVSLCTALVQQGRPEAALETVEEAVQLAEKIFTKDHSRIAWSLQARAEALDLAGRNEEALAERQRVLEIRRKAYGEVHSSVADAEDGLGRTLQALGKSAEAVPHHRTAVGIYEKLAGEDAFDTAHARERLANALLAVGQAAEARDLYQRALQRHRRLEGDESLNNAPVLTGLGSALLQLGDVPGSLEALESAGTLYQRWEGDPLPVARTSFALARAQLAAGDRAGAKEAATRALRTMRALGARARGPSREVEKWVAARKLS